MLSGLLIATVPFLKASLYQKISKWPVKSDSAIHKSISLEKKALTGLLKATVPFLKASLYKKIPEWPVESDSALL